MSPPTNGRSTFTYLRSQRICRSQCVRNQDAKNTQHHKISILDSVVAASSMNITCPPPLFTKLVLCVIESDREYLFRDLDRCCCRLVAAGWQLTLNCPSGNTITNFQIPYFPILPEEWDLKINKLSCPPNFCVTVPVTTTRSLFSLENCTIVPWPAPALSLLSLATQELCKE